MKVLFISLGLLTLTSAALGQQANRHGINPSGWDQLLRVSCGLAGNGAGQMSAFSDLFGYGIGISNTASPTVDQLKVIAVEMSESSERAIGLKMNETGVAAGLIFLGQFIDHDITLDVVSRLSEAADPSEIRNLRTPRLDLDSLYLDGPDASSFLYDRLRPGYFLIGRAGNRIDLPRNEQSRAVIGDPRNDENVVISQLHSMFLRFHNAVLQEVEWGGFDDQRLSFEEGNFELARRLVRWHYQWIVLNEFLPNVVDPGVLQAVIDSYDSGGWCKTGALPALPIEFSAAAYRFGHSQIRGHLKLKRNQPAIALFDRKGGIPGFQPIDPEHVIDWSLFFRTTRASVQPARRLDTFLARELLDLSFETEGPGANLALRNLLRGELTFRLPSGEQARDFFMKMGDTIPELPLHAVIQKSGLEKTPLWFYCLQESEQSRSGKLGHVGGRIVAATFLRMLHRDSLTYLNKPKWTELSGHTHTDEKENQAGEVGVDPISATRAETWEPVIGPGRDFTMADLIRFVEAAEGR